MITCPYCGSQAELVTGEKIYPHRHDLRHLEFWLCEPCDAYVGVHKDGSNRPLGTLANAETRMERRNLHSLFDPFWRDGDMNRSEAYRRLASEMGIDREKCHIGMFTLEQCETAKVIVSAWNHSRVDWSQVPEVIQPEEIAIWTRNTWEG